MLLYGYEAKGIQGYVFATQKMKEIIGASSLVEQLRDKGSELVRRAGGVEVMAAAGKGVATFPDNDALEEMAAQWPAFCAHLAPGLQVVQAWIEVGDAAPQRADWDRLAKKLSAARQQVWVNLPEAGPLVARSGKTGLPAREEDRHDGLLDQASARKRDVFTEAGDLLASRLADEGAHFVQDLDRLGEEGLAVVHADGDRIGELVQEVAGEVRRYKAFAEGLGNATAEAAREAISRLRDEVDPDRTGQTALPARPVLLGGDDLTIVLSQRHAIPFTVLFLRAFQRATARRLSCLANGLEEVVARRLREGLSASAGIAFVKLGYPFHAAYDLAEELCRFAKDAGDPAGQLAFHRVTTSSIGSWRRISTVELSYPGFTLVGGPWSASDQGLSSIEHVRTLANLVGSRDLPRGAVREWATLAVTSPDRAEAAWERLKTVLSDTARGRETHAELERSLDALGASDCSPWAAPRDGRRRTPVYDALTWAAVAGKPALWKEAN